MTTEDMIKTIGKNQKLTQEVVKNVIKECYFKINKKYRNEKSL